jgi:hypothetical protein
MNASNLAEEYHSSTSSAECSSAISVTSKLRKGMARATGAVKSRRTSSERKVIVVEVPNILVDKYPLSLEERVKKVREKLSKMTKAEKWKLVEQSFGMWEDYPEDWLDKLREGTLNFEYQINDTNNQWNI